MGLKYSIKLNTQRGDDIFKGRARYKFDYKCAFCIVVFLGLN